MLIEGDQWASDRPLGSTAQPLLLKCLGEVEWALYRQRMHSAIAVTLQRADALP